MSTEPRLRIGLAQLNFLVGDAQGNAARVIDAVARASAGAKPDLLVFPELTLSGYPPEDLLFHGGFRQAIDRALGTVRDAVRGMGVIVGYPEYVGRDIYNSAALLCDGALIVNHRKRELPNYKVFDEKRYFRAGTEPTVFEHRGFRIGLLVCEDIWECEAATQARDAGAELLIIINASPFEVHKQHERERVTRDRIAQVKLPVAYVNMLGGQDELVFDGNSFVMDATGKVVMRAPGFEEGTYLIEFVRENGRVVPVPGSVAAELSDVATVYQALVMGVRDYVTKHAFPGVVMGLSGGVDSALTLAIAADALGPDRIHAVMMPSRYTAQMSLDDAQRQARDMGVHYSVIPIEGMFAATLAALEGEFAGRKPDTTEENIQSRCRMRCCLWAFPTRPAACC